MLVFWQPPISNRLLTIRNVSVGSKILVVMITICVNYSTDATTTRYASRIVETKSGQIRGILQDLNNRHLDPVEVFRGVPYAAPPMGNLRFRPPMSPIPWNGVKMADTFGPVCPQNYPDISNDSVALSTMPFGRYQQLKELVLFLTNQSEDCLFLNLYIPGSGSRGLEAPYAVMVYVHGESFEWGSGNFYDGAVLASAGHVIVITLNYRLGLLGFLRTSSSFNDSTGFEGNLALKDIAMGLHWVRENIAAFGGDPNRITLMGHDTGAALVNFLLLASYGKGLFHRAILSSGSALSPWASMHDPNNVHLTVLAQVQCLKGSDKDIAECLRNVSLETLMSVELPEIRFVPRIGPSLPIDKDIADPSVEMERASDAFIEMPLILGVSTTESSLDFNANDIQFGFEDDYRNRILRTFIRNTYVYHLNEIFSAVRNEYTDWEKSSHPITIRESTMEALSDGHTVAPLTKIAFYHARRGAKTYFYHFNHQTKDSGYLQRLGSVRGEGIPYIFGLPLDSGGYFFQKNYSRPDQGIAEAVLTFFTNFAKTGNPNEPHKIESVDYGTPKEKTRFRGLTWDPYETSSQQYLMIAPKAKMKSHYRGHKMSVWLNLIPQLHQVGNNGISMRHHHLREQGEHSYAGPVRDEFMPVPLAGTMGTSSLTSACSTHIVDNPLSNDVVSILNDNSDEAKMLQHLASRHYYSTTTALAITVGVGCVLLVLNMLIFAGIYYQRDRDKKRITTEQNFLYKTCAMENLNPVQEPPPLYTTLSKIPQNEQRTHLPLDHESTMEIKPTNTPKKRVQIQEISV